MTEEDEMADLGKEISGAGLAMSRMVAEATEQLIAAYYVETGTTGAGTSATVIDGKTWVTVEPGDRSMPALPFVYVGRRAGEYLARTSLRPSSAAVVYGFDCLTFTVYFRLRQRATHASP